MDNTLKGRLTSKKLVKWVNEQFKKLEIENYEVTEITRTHFSQDAYECGACKLYVRFRNKSLPDDHFFNSSVFLCFYSISEYQDYLNSGYELYIKNTERNGTTVLLQNLTIEVRKIKTTYINSRDAN